MLVSDRRAQRKLPAYDIAILAMESLCIGERNPIRSGMSFLAMALGLL